MVFSSYVIYLICYRLPNLIKSSAAAEENTTAELVLHASVLAGLVGGIYLWIQMVAKKIKRNETAYKYTAGGLEKMLAVFSNSYARKAVFRSWQIRLGLVSNPVQVGDAASECDLVDLNNSPKKLVKDFINATADMPLILNIGSYN